MNLQLENRLISTLLKLSLVALSSLTFSCSKQIDPWSAATITSQPVEILPFKRLPNSHGSVTVASTFIEPIDVDSIELTSYRDQEFYQPVNLCHRCLLFIATFHETGDTVYLTRAIKYANKLREISVNYQDASFVPYMINYAVHSDSAIAFQRPWYSGMAQGELLSVSVRLFEITNDSTWYTFSKKLINSLYNLKQTDKPWVSRLDSLGYFWIEEYPHDSLPGRTLNGFIAALYGVYDAYRVLDDPKAKTMYNASVTTLKYYLPYYRRPEKPSYYCLGHRHEANKNYHTLHVSMMKHLQRISGDPFFGVMAQIFSEDAPPVP